MPSLRPNLVRRIDRLPKPTRTSEAMLPLFEAISNSIQSTQSKFKDSTPDKGAVSVEVNISRKRTPVTISVLDNGVGLDDENFDAFCTTDTDNKIVAGGKGVGRLFWLDCFEQTHVESIYAQGGALRKRSFDFRLAIDDQIANYEDGIVGGDAPTGMHVTFKGLRDNGYQANFPGRASYVFQHFASHFLPTFIGKNAPQVTLTCGHETKIYPSEIDDLIFRRSDIEDVATTEFGAFRIVLLECDRVLSSDLKGMHFIHFIANERTVVSQRIDGKLGLKAFGPDSNRVFHACLFGDFLNRKVNQERTNFTFGDTVLERIVNEVCVPLIEEFLSSPLEELKQDQGNIVRAITERYPSVAFGTVEELQRHVPSGELSDDAIYGHLSRERFRRDTTQAEHIRDVLGRLRGDDLDEESLAVTLSEASSAIEDAERRSLAEYIVRRKVVLDFIEVLLQRVRAEDADSSFQREDLLHSFICPMQTKTVGASTGRIVPAASHDLWIVDERLTFTSYFSSDVPFSELLADNSDGERPDLLVFDRVHGLRQSDQASKVLLVEFKRPNRRAYRDNENPVEQVQRYVAKLLAGQLTDVRGRPIVLGNDAVFHCFIVADIVGRMDDWTGLWPRTPDGRGRFFQPGSGFRGTIEVIGWDSLLRDARERNQAFFDRAGIAGGNLFEVSDTHSVQREAVD